MTATASTLFARTDFHETVAMMRDNVAVVVDEPDPAMIQLEAEVGAAARRLRDANRAAPVVTGGRDGITVAADVVAQSYRDVRQAASDADRMQRHQQLAARGAALLAVIEANRPAAPESSLELATRSLFSR